MSEPFADLEFDKATGELKGRGHAVALTESAAGHFNHLWRARRERDFISIDAPMWTLARLRKAIRRFDITIEGKAYIGRRLVDLRMQGEAKAS